MLGLGYVINQARRVGSQAEEALTEALGYDYVEETANPAYRMFLGR
jgi:hypothetical protein